MRALKCGSILPYQIELSFVGRLKWKCEPLFSSMPSLMMGPGVRGAHWPWQKSESVGTNVLSFHTLVPQTDRRPLSAFPSLESLTSALSARWLFAENYGKLIPGIPAEYLFPQSLTQTAGHMFLVRTLVFMLSTLQQSCVWEAACRYIRWCVVLSMLFTCPLVFSFHSLFDGCNFPFCRWETAGTQVENSLTSKHFF